MISAKLLVVDDEPDICNLVKEILEDEGYDVSMAENGEQARELRNKVNPALFFLCNGQLTQEIFIEASWFAKFHQDLHGLGLIKR